MCMWFVKTRFMTFTFVFPGREWCLYDWSRSSIFCSYIKLSKTWKAYYWPGSSRRRWVISRIKVCREVTAQRSLRLVLSVKRIIQIPHFVVIDVVPMKKNSSLVFIITIFFPVQSVIALSWTFHLIQPKLSQSNLNSCDVLIKPRQMLEIKSFKKSQQIHGGFYSFLLFVGIFVAFERKVVEDFNRQQSECCKMQWSWTWHIGYFEIQNENFWM